MNAPTLLVGLGGTGSKIVQRVYDRATPAQRRNIGFVVFDTDVNELREISEKTPDIYTIQTSAKLTVGEYLDVDHYARDRWFPVNRILNGKALTEGAGQVRAVSRLALNTAIQQGKMEPLNQAIESLYKLKGQRLTQAPRVILAGSLCGGTGSGLILPVALYIRNYMRTRLQESSTIIRGFFLLPEVFDGVIKTQSERNNLRSNAYAAVREIDTFMMKDDGSLPEKYDIHFMVPRAGSRELDEYIGRPMDFCFLFDSQNLRGMKLNSFVEYMEHAANCIYGMAIAPTSKRSNSSEDNVIREIVFAGGRNRFAGAGSSMLIFPKDDVEKYLSLVWTKESVSDEWLEVDRRYAEEMKSNRDQRKKGYQVAPINRGEHYVKIVNDGVTNRNPFASEIRNMCIEYDSTGYVERGINWVQYADALDAYIADRVSDQLSQLEELTEELKLAAAAGSEKDAMADVFSNWYRNLLGYKSATIKCTESLSRTIEYTLFKEQKDYTRTSLKFRMEYWLHSNGDSETFIHPNAVRYFLYNALTELTRRKAESHEMVRETEEYWENFERRVFDIADTEDHQETEDEYYEASHLKAEKLERFLHRRQITEARDNLKAAFSTLQAQTTEYWTNYVSEQVYNSAIEYINSLCSAFHDFYDVLDRNLKSIDRDIEQLEGKYFTSEGEARRYVCADADCLKGMAAEIVNPTSCLEMPAEINRRIFNQMKAFALRERKSDSEAYFLNTFNGTIVRYMGEQINSHYGSLVGMDIITALQREAHYKMPDQLLTLHDEQIYAQHVLDATEILANPFISSPVGKEARVIPACCYNPALPKADFPERRKFVNANLKDHGGVEDESIDPNMILFYQAVYDLRANELGKFAPPKKSETDDRPTGGEYFNAYYELIQNLHPQPDMSKAITPHIDRWWHIISKMPDLDEGNQIAQEKAINAAFFWGMLSGYVQYEPDGDFGYIYAIDRTALNMGEESTRMFVSNGTPCDHLYEVQDSITIYPKLVSRISQRVRDRITLELEDKVPLEKGFVNRLLKQFRLPEFRLEKSEENPDGIRSILELPILMKCSVPTETYYEENVIQLLEVILEEVKAYLGRYCTKNELSGVYGGELFRQYQLMLLNLESNRRYMKNLYDDSLVIHIFRTVARELEACYMSSEADQVREKLMELREQI